MLDQLLQAAVQNGITGRVELGQVPGAEDGDDLPPLHQDRVRRHRARRPRRRRGGVRAGAGGEPQGPRRRARAWPRCASCSAPQGVDLAAARAAAAADPTDVEAAITVADLDVLGGHVEDAFTRLLDLVRTSAGDERDRARTHLLELFNVVGNHDERVRKGRTALMSALF